MIWETYWGLILALIIGVPTLCVALFAVWMSKVSTASGDVAAKYWDVFVKLISAFTVIFSGALLFGKYIDQQRVIQIENQKNAAREIALQEAGYLQQKLVFDQLQHEKKDRLLSEAKTLASRLANMETPDPDLVLRFQELYFAELIGVERRGGPVETAMVQFNRHLKSQGDAASLQPLSLALSRAVVTELADSQAAILEQYKQINALLTQPKP